MKSKSFRYDTEFVDLLHIFFKNIFNSSLKVSLKMRVFIYIPS